MRKIHTVMVKILSFLLETSMALLVLEIIFGNDSFHDFNYYLDFMPISIAVQIYYHIFTFWSMLFVDFPRESFDKK